MTREAKWVGAFMFVLGLFSALSGAALLIFGRSSEAVGSSCKAICGLAMLATQLVGPVAGQLVGGVFYLYAGIAFSVFGWAVYKG